MKSLKDNLYLQDILSQGGSLMNALDKFNPAASQKLAVQLRNHDYDRIVVTGMGGSFFATYPSWLILINAGRPAILVDSAELIHHGRSLITKRTLVWATSQSGHSAEIISVLELVKQAGATLLSTVNDTDSPLARAAGEFVLPIHAEPEKTVSSRTYVNTLGISQLAALSMTNGDINQGMSDLQTTARSLSEYLLDWETHLGMIQKRVIPPRYMVLLGRGPSLAAAKAGALILGEAAKYPAIGMQSGEFRHGPMELISPNLSVLIFAGPPETQDLNRRLYKDLVKTDSRTFWISPSNETDPESHIEMPRGIGRGLPLAEIVPIQLLTIHIAAANNVEPGKFFRISKITLSE